MRHLLRCPAVTLPARPVLLALAEYCGPKIPATMVVVPAALAELWQEWWLQWEKQVWQWQLATQPAQPKEGQHLVGKLEAATLRPELLACRKKAERHPVGAYLPN